MAKSIMLMGTSSHVGKSILTTALCRIFRQEGCRAVPFKAQNMALNSYVTLDGREMGRAQVAQAEAAGLAPMVDMNPVLLKPTGNAQSQVIIMGEPVGNMSAREYHKGYSLKAWGAVEEALERLQEEYDMLVIEGAGSPAEINLKANDIVNMRVAKHLQAPVLLIADIDRGGALASLVGTLELLDEEERALVKGLVINKFRGDVTLLAPALTFLEEKTGKPVLGVVPHIEQLGIDEEDSVSLDEKHYGDAAAGADQLRIAVIRTPKLSNFTDFDALANEPDAALYYVSAPAELGTPDLILLPGSKNTTEDLLYIRESGLEAAIRRFGRRKEKFWAHLNRHRGRWGTRKACKVLAQALYGIDSVHETYARYAITHALPKLTVDAQAIFSTPSKNPSFTTYYRADLLVNNWLIIEIDGAIKYQGTPEQRAETYAKQIAREQSIAKHGYYFLRVAPSQIGPALINHINNLTTHIHYDQLPHQHQLVNLSVAPPWWQLREERMNRR